MIKKTILVYFLLVLFGQKSFAQINPINNNDIEQYRMYLIQKDKLRIEKINQYVTENKMAKNFYDAKGNYVYIHHINEMNQPVYYQTKSNLDLAKSVKTNKCWNGGGLNLDLQGQNMEVSASRARLGVWEPGPTRIDHKEFAGRATTRDLPAFTIHDGNSDHATHVVGTMIGLGMEPSTRGMANQAKIDCYETGTSEEEEMLIAASQGMLVSNHSYGPSYDNTKTLQGMYNGEARTYDSILYLNKYYLPCFAIGNERDDTKNITWDVASGGGLAKNALGIGAVDLLGPGGYTGPASVIATDFTNYGPADDGRIKPDFVAPGKGIFSASSKSDTDHISKDGTSMSTPGVAGSIFLLQEYYKEKKGGIFMKAATLKDVVIHACEEAGVGPGPDAKFGWGLLNMEKVYDVIWNYNKNHILEEAVLANGGTYNNKIHTTGGAFKVTICWTDLPGPATASNVKDDRTSKLVNDLDVRIIDSATNVAVSSLPWKLDPLNPANAATKGDNAVDNVEQIMVDNLPAGTYFVRVNHKGTLSSSQEFSIAMSGLSSSVSKVFNNDFNKQVQLYPNPTKGMVTIDLVENMSNVQVKVKNIIGQTISNKMYNNTEKVETMIEGEKGVYFVEINTNDGRQATIKVIKE